MSSRFNLWIKGLDNVFMLTGYKKTKRNSFTTPCRLIIHINFHHDAESAFQHFSKWEKIRTAHVYNMSTLDSHYSLNGASSVHQICRFQARACVSLWLQITTHYY